jgi:hypothetical protein
MNLTHKSSPPRRAARSQAAAVLIMLLAPLVTGCGGAGQSPEVAQHSTTSSPPSTTDAARPVGLMAIGHSGLTAENSDASQPGLPVMRNSWATGGARRVDSVYTRLVGALPQTWGHVVNAAVGGALVTDLPGQASAALAVVPHPALVIVQTIDNDIRCDGTDAGNTADFGGTLKDVLTSITRASPASKVLVVGQLGRPNPAFIRHEVAAHPEVRAGITGPGICDFYDPHGRLDRGAFTRLTKIIDGYESEQARICARFTNCHTDGGVRAAYQDRLANFTGDFAHLNVRGQAAEAALIWPVVTRILGLD